MRKIFIEISCKNDEYCELDCPFLWNDGNEKLNEPIENADCEGPWRCDWDKQRNPTLPLVVIENTFSNGPLIKRHQECIRRELKGESV